MEAYNITNLLKELMEDPHIFICGPSYGNTKKPPKTKLRVYAHGGVLCELPTTQRAAITLCHKNYFKDEPSLRDSFNGLQNKEATEKFLWDHRDKLVDIMGKRFTSKGKSPEERNQQTIIARAYTDFSQNGGTVVCDFESSLPKSMGQPNFDLVTFSMDKTDGGVYTLVEYKCSARACKAEKSGLKKHADDMLHCMTDSTASDWYKRELLRRLGYMCRYGLLRNYPDGLDHLSPENVELRAGFLFTSGDGLKSRHDAVELCRTYIPEKDLDKFLYCFAERPVDVGLSHMKNWEAFSGKK